MTDAGVNDWNTWMDWWEQQSEFDQRNEWDRLEREDPQITQYLMTEFNDRMRAVMENWHV
jgi:hypothetical protein